MQWRSDLALEAAEGLSPDALNPEDVFRETEERDGARVTRIAVRSEKGILHSSGFNRIRSIFVY